MPRYTKSNLISAIEDTNKLLADSGSLYSYQYQSRNGYYAIDLYKDGKCIHCLDCNETPKILAYKLEQDYTYYLNK